MKSNSRSASTRCFRFGAVWVATAFATALAAQDAQDQTAPEAPAAQAMVGAKALPVLTLEQAYALALERDPVFLAARAQYRATREQLPQARALLRPNVALSGLLTSSWSQPRTQSWVTEPVEVQSTSSTSASGTATESSTSSTASGQDSTQRASESFTSETSTFQQDAQQSSTRKGHADEWESVHRRTRGAQAQAEVNLTWPIYRPALQRSVEQSEFLDEQGSLILQAARQDVAVRVVQAYLDVVLVKEVLVALGAQERALRQQLEGAQSSFEQGVVSIADVREAKANLDLVLAQQVVQQNQWRIKRAALQSMIGFAAPEVQSMREGAASHLLPDPGGVEHWMGMAEAGSVEIRVQYLALQAARKEVEKQKAARRPTLDFVANVGTMVSRDRSRSSSTAEEANRGSDSSHSESQRDTQSESDIRTQVQSQFRSVNETQAQRNESSAVSSSETNSQSASHTRTIRPDSSGRTWNRQWDMYVGIRLNVPLSDGGLSGSKAREALALREVHEADLHRAKSEAALATQTAYLEWMGFTAELGALRAAQTSSLVALEANQLGYEVGLKTNSDVLNAQQQLFAVRRDIVKARVNGLIAWVRLKASVGDLDAEDMARVAMELVSCPGNSCMK